MQVDEEHSPQGEEQVCRFRQEHDTRHAVRQQVLQKRNDSHQIPMRQDHIDSDEELVYEKEGKRAASVDDTDQKDKGRLAEAGAVESFTLFVGRHH